MTVLRRHRGFGDHLMLNPVLRAYKQQYPDEPLTLACRPEYHALYRGNDFLDRLTDVYVDASKEAVVDLSAAVLESDGSTFHRTDVWADVLKVSVRDPRPFYRVFPEEEKPKIKPTITIHCDAAEDKRCWPKENIEAVISAFPDHCIRLFDQRPVEYSIEKTVAGSTRELAAYIQASDLFIGPDSGPMHLAGALGVPSVVLFGPTVPISRLKYYPESVGVTAGDCLGCWYKVCSVHKLCMRSIKSERVIAYAGAILSGRKPLY